MVLIKTENWIENVLIILLVNVAMTKSRLFIKSDLSDVAKMFSKNDFNQKGSGRYLDRQTSDENLVYMKKSRPNQCGYQGCPSVKENMLNVHLVSHTHNDVGWLKTVDQYYYGSRRDITPVGVQYILDSVVSALVADPQRRFIYVEMAFFKRWWDEQDDRMRHLVKQLVQKGQLEFILGGWSMNDEAATMYDTIIDQHTLGFNFLRETFGDCARPRVAWQIDPFGHSREVASLFAQMGFDGVFHGRIDYEDRGKRKKEKSMEMLWHASPVNLEREADIFTGILNSSYGPPAGFCFDVYCDSEPIMDDPRMHDYNVQEKVTDFLKQVNYQHPNYKTQHIMMTMGNDFNYVDANSWFKNLDKLIKYVNGRQLNGSQVNVLYSTPSCYLHQLYLSNLTWPTKSDDFFPYAHRPHAYWTGYFTSRPTHKRFSRYANNILQALKQLTVLSGMDDHALHKLREAVAVVQHHDAITGTAKQAVANDYAQRVHSALVEAQDILRKAQTSLLFSNYPDLNVTITTCNLLNISECHPTEHAKKVIVFIYNPLNRNLSTPVRIPIQCQYNYTVTDHSGSFLESHTVQIPDWVKAIPERHSVADCNLIFLAESPSFGFYFYLLTRKDKSIQVKAPENNGVQDSDIEISNEYVKLSFDGTSNRLKSYTSLTLNKTLSFTIQLGYYKGFAGNNSQPEFSASGAYLFRPLENDATLFNPKITKVTKDSVVEEVWQQFSDWLHLVVRVYKNCNHQNMEVEWTAGPIPISDGVGKEVVIRYATENINNSGIFYTDANGREILTRKRNHRDTWNLTTSEPVSSNYYPVNNRIFIQDIKNSLQMSVLTDRSEGGSSLRDGYLELMLHRRLLYDDGLGVGEALNEVGSDKKGLRVIGKHTVIINSIKHSAEYVPDRVRWIQLEPVLSFSADSADSLLHSLRKKKLRKYVVLPFNVNLLTLERWTENSVLIRLEHYYEKGANNSYSKNVSLNLKEVLPTMTFEHITEMTLGANQEKSAQRRWNWRTKDSHTPAQHSHKEKYQNYQDPFHIALKPMQIRTFILKIKTLMF